MKSIWVLCFGLSSALASNCLAEKLGDPNPSAERGASVYVARCELCHGESAKGDGILPSKIETYPNTDLLKPSAAQSKDKLMDAVVYGGSKGQLSEHMPPFGEELSWTDLQSVTMLLEQAHADYQGAMNLIQAAKKMHREGEAKHIGKTLYESRCVLCHGENGLGDGRMSKILKSPPPTNLTLSRLPDPYLHDIIKKGGEAVGRSKHMPPWGDHFKDSEISAIIVYLNSLREHE